jgi:hypothetical protein
MARGEIIDRIAVSVGNRVITASDLDREIRVAAFQDGVKADFSPAHKRKTVESMIEQKLIQIELEGAFQGRPGVSRRAGPLRHHRSRFQRTAALAAYAAAVRSGAL